MSKDPEPELEGINFLAEVFRGNLSHVKNEFEYLGQADWGYFINLVSGTILVKYPQLKPLLG